MARWRKCCRTSFGELTRTGASWRKPTRNGCCCGVNCFLGWRSPSRCSLRLHYKTINSSKKERTTPLKFTFSSVLYNKLAPGLRKTFTYVALIKPTGCVLWRLLLLSHYHNVGQTGKYEECRWFIYHFCLFLLRERFAYKAKHLSWNSGKPRGQNAHCIEKP